MSKKRIGTLLKKYRLDNFLTQIQMANMLGIPYRTYQGWELGDRTPSTASLLFLESFLESEENGTH